jgi:hypothetical protein
MPTARYPASFNARATAAKFGTPLLKTNEIYSFEYYLSLAFK